MRVRVLSDLHLEFGNWRPPEVEADVVVLAGDIHQGREAKPWMERFFSRTPVVYVLGNHEFYGQAMPELIGLLRRRTRGTSIHLLENSSVAIAGFRFLGCSLWTDFCIKGNQRVGMLQAELGMSDYACIINNREGRRLSAEDTLAIHRESRAWLEAEIPRGDPARTIVVTHHAPSPKSEAEHHSNSPLAPAFASNLDALIEPSGVPLWIHGHTHHNVDYRLGRTRVISNQRGYPEDLAANFRGDLVVEL